MLLKMTDRTMNIAGILGRKVYVCVAIGISGQCFRLYYNHEFEGEMGCLYSEVNQQLAQLFVDATAATLSNILYMEETVGHNRRKNVRNNEEKHKT